MRQTSIYLYPAAALGLVVLAASARRDAPAGTRMVKAASALLDSLPPELRRKASRPADSGDRADWHFVPYQRAGKPLRRGVGLFELTGGQRAAAMDLLKAATSAKGYTQATAVMKLEGVLRQLEAGRGAVRDPQWYFLTVYGEPTLTGKWGFSIEGHHLSINYYLDKGEVVATSPLFFGSNPARLTAGAAGLKQGHRAIPECEDLAIKLYNSLDAGQKKTALRPEHFPEVSQTERLKVGDPVGLPAAAMTDAQRATLRELIAAYANRMPPQLAARELKRALKDEAKIHFAFTGRAKLGEPHTYRVRGANFVIEFLNTQKDSLGNRANHAHSVWRRLPKDF